MKRSATGSPGRSEGWGVWGAISGPPSSASAFGEVLGADQDLARLGAVAGAKDAVLLHHVDEARGLRIPQPHTALQERDRALALADDEVHRVPVEIVAVLGVAAL